MPMPRNGFDNLAAVARLNDDNTMHHRERWPSLAGVWDELDDLRRWQDEALEAERDALSEAVRLLLEPEPDMERVQDILMGVGDD